MNIGKFAIGLGLVCALWQCKSTRSRLQEASTANVQNFVNVQNGQLMLEGHPFRFVGSNFYRLALSDAFGAQVIQETYNGKVTYPQIEKVMENYAAEGIKVVRLWTFSCEGSRGTNVVPPILNKDFSLNPKGLRQLDFTIASAARHGIKLIFPLVNFEHEYCGMEWWVENVQAIAPADAKSRFLQSCLSSDRKLQAVAKAGESCPAGTTSASTKELFYTESLVRAKFKEYVTELLQRPNSYTGVVLRDDPTIMAIEVSNEPHTSDFYECMLADPSRNTLQRCQDIIDGKVSGLSYASFQPGTLVYNWLSDISAFVKSIDKNHLVSTGEEAYRTSHESARCFQFRAWIHNGSKGVDFARDASIPTVDIMSTHLYPDNWGVRPSELKDFYDCVFADRARLAAEHGKPIFMEESGFRESSYLKPGESAGAQDELELYPKDRAYYISRMFAYALTAGFQGTMVWQAAPLTVNDQVAEKDSFTFPILNRVNGKAEYTREGFALARQVECMNSLEQGGSVKNCRFLCPKEQSSDGFWAGDLNYACRAYQGGSSTASGEFPLCPSGVSAPGGWGWVTDETLCNAYSKTADQFKTNRGCSCKAL